eukprot:11756120-Prorocentrum_lima.AAC.1
MPLKEGDEGKAGSNPIHVQTPTRIHLMYRVAPVFASTLDTWVETAAGSAALQHAAEQSHDVYQCGAQQQRWHGLAMDTRPTQSTYILQH